MASDWLFGFVSKSLRYGFARFSACRLQRWKTFFSPQAFSTLPPLRPPTLFSFSYHTTLVLGVGCKSLILFPPNPWLHEWKSSQILGYHKKLRCSAASKIIWFKVIYVFGGETLFTIKSFEPKHQQKRQTNRTSCFEPHWTDWMEKVFWKVQALLDTHIVCAFKCFHSSISEEQSRMLILANIL